MKCDYFLLMSGIILTFASAGAMSGERGVCARIMIADLQKQNEEYRDQDIGPIRYRYCKAQLEQLSTAAASKHIEEVVRSFNPTCALRPGAVVCAVALTKKSTPPHCILVKDESAIAAAPRAPRRRPAHRRPGWGFNKQ